MRQTACETCQSKSLSFCTRGMCQTARLEILEVSVTAFELSFKIVCLGYDLVQCIRGCSGMDMDAECGSSASVSILWSVWFKNLSASRCID